MTSTDLTSLLGQDHGLNGSGFGYGPGYGDGSGYGSSYGYGYGSGSGYGKCSTPEHLDTLHE